MSVKSAINNIFPCSNLGNDKFPVRIYFFLQTFFFPSPLFHYRDSPMGRPGLTEERLESSTLHGPQGLSPVCHAFKVIYSSHLYFHLLRTFLFTHLLVYFGLYWVWIHCSYFSSELKYDPESIYICSMRTFLKILACSVTKSSSILSSSKWGTIFCFVLFFSSISSNVE